MAGEARRFKEAGYTLPKPLIWVGDKQIIDLSISSINYDKQDRFTFIVRREHVDNFSIDEALYTKFNDLFDVEIVVLDKPTKGSPFTCLEAQIDSYEPLVIFTPDIAFSPSFNPSVMEDSDGFLLTFKANSSAHSYCAGEYPNVDQVAEKVVISNYANIGLYGFGEGRHFVKAAKTLKESDKVNGEYYIAPLYNKLIERGLTVRQQSVDTTYVLGTPEDVEFYKKYTRRHLKDKIKIGLACDHSGIRVKKVVKEILEEVSSVSSKIELIIDYGTYGTKSCDYPDYIKPLCEAVRTNEIDIGIISCSTGQGVQIACNKEKGIIAALVSSSWLSSKAVEHNCANVFAIPEDFFSPDKDELINYTPEVIEDILSGILNSKFIGGRHQTRLQKIL